MAYIKLGNNDLGRVAIGDKLLGDAKEFPAIFKLDEGSEPVGPVWLLEGSIWNDNGVWVDTATWID
jgi:hypothetical protein